MNLVDLIVLACSISDPTSCRELHLKFDTTVSLQACVMQAQPYLAQWAGEHPNLTVKRWHCEWPEREGQGI